MPRQNLDSYATLCFGMYMVQSLLCYRLPMLQGNSTTSEPLISVLAS
jgi:hypothetical protein